MVDFFIWKKTQTDYRGPGGAQYPRDWEETQGDIFTNFARTAAENDILRNAYRRPLRRRTPERSACGRFMRFRSFSTLLPAAVFF